MQPDTLIQNVYDPQSLNRYSFERSNPYKYTDEDGHYAIPVIAGVGGFFAGAIGYWVSTPIDRDNPQWGKRLGLGLLSGLNVGVNSALIASGSLTSAGGAIRFAGGSGLAAFGRTTAYTGLGSTSMQLYNSLITQERIRAADYATNLAIDIVTGNFQIYKMGGEFAPISNLDSRSGIKFAINYFAQTTFATASQGFLNLLQQLNLNLNGNNANQAGNSQPSQGSNSDSGSGGGYVPGVGYVTDDGRTYPTNNPDWKPCGCSIN